MLKSVVGKKEYVIECLNHARHLNSLNNQNVPVYDVKKLNFKTLRFVTYASDDKKNKAEFRNAKIISVKNKSGVCFLGEKLLKNLIVILCFLCSFALFFVLNRFVWQIKVFSPDEFLTLQINSYLKDNRIKIGKVKSFYNTDSIKAEILNKFSDVVLVDVEIKNQTLIINARQKIFEVKVDEELLTPLVAEFDCIVESVNLISGTAKVKKGDVVRAGEVLAEAYTLRDGKIYPSKIDGEITVRGFVTKEFIFEEYSTILVRTGKKITKNYFTFFNNFDKIKLEKNVFDKNETEIILENETIFPLLPIKLTSVCFYELKSVQNFQSFEENKAEIENSFKTETLNGINPIHVFSEELKSEKVAENTYKIVYYVDFLKTY